MKVFLQILVAALLLWLVIRNVDLRTLADAFSNLRLQTIIATTAIFFLSCGVAVSKWRLLWNKATWSQMLNANFVSQLYSLVLPGQLAGEVVKTFRVGRQFSDTAGVAVSILVDRATGLVGLLILACGGALLSGNTVGRSAAGPLAVVTAGILCALYAITLPSVSGIAASIARRVGTRYRWLYGVSSRAIEFLAGWASLVSRGRTTFAAIALGAVYQAMCIAMNCYVAADMGIEMSVTDWCWVFGLISIALLLPITISGIGVREGSYAGLLGLLGVPLEKALAVSIVVFGISLLGALAGAIVEVSSYIGARRGK